MSNLENQQVILTSGLFWEICWHIIIIWNRYISFNGGHFHHKSYNGEGWGGQGSTRSWNMIPLNYSEQLNSFSHNLNQIA